MTTSYDEPATEEVEDRVERIRIAERAGRPSMIEPDDGELFVRAAHEVARERLADKRRERDELNETIRELVAQEEVLRRAVAVFDRVKP